jgi:hypothetical protein
LNGRIIGTLIVMRTIQLLLAGLLLMGGFLLVGKLFSGQFADALRVATWVFVVVWLAVASVNMWAGVAKAGYSVADELPIFLVIFAVPAALAVLLKWRFL